MSLLDGVCASLPKSRSTSRCPSLLEQCTSIFPLHSPSINSFVVNVHHRGTDSFPEETQEGRYPILLVFGGYACDCFSNSCASRLVISTRAKITSSFVGGSIVISGTLPSPARFAIQLFHTTPLLWKPFFCFPARHLSDPHAWSKRTCPSTRP